MEESLKEGSVYLLENLNFRPDENSFVKPWVDPDEKENKKKGPRDLPQPAER